MKVPISHYRDFRRRRCHEGLNKDVSLFISTDSSGKEKEGGKKGERQRKKKYRFGI